jgi:hypothetical protein
MTDVLFRSNDISVGDETAPMPKASNEATTQPIIDIEPPFTNYRSEKNQSYIAKYLGIEEGWDDKNVYGKEINEIEEFFKDKIDRGDIDNSTEAVKETLKKYEKEIGCDKTERMVVKVQKLIAYLSFRRVVDEIERNSKIYGSTR